MTYEIKVATFQGPFDLLLYFIKRDEIDIYDIPIARLSLEFLEYIKKLKELNIEVAGEFILVAATLMSIKAKMLLPRKELDEEGNEIDPRQDLVARLLEYKRYKDVLDDIRILESKRQSMTSRGNLLEELQVHHEKNSVYEELTSVDLYKLLKTFHKVLNRLEDRESTPKHVVVQYPYTIEGQRKYLLGKISILKKVDFLSIVEDSENKAQVIFTFLAILELIQVSKISITVGEGYNNFWLEEQLPEAA